MAHGGHCVARHEGRVVFVRHALPGEVVLARLTEGGDAQRFWRADAVEVLQASPHRVAARCPVSGPGGCGGCDWQHVEVPEQRRLKAAVVREQLRRLGGVDVPHLEVEAVEGDADGLGWRTRVRFAVDGEGRVGLRAHRSHAVVAVQACPLAHRRVAELGVGLRSWTGAAAVEVVAPAGSADRLVLLEPLSPGARVDVPPLGGEAAVAVLADGEVRGLRGRTWVEEVVEVDGSVRRFRVSGSGFWQVHPGAPAALVGAVLAMADPRPGELALDLYSGVGLLAAALAGRVGASGRVLAVESQARAVADARRSLHDLPAVTLAQGRVERVLPQWCAPGGPAEGGADVVVLDPPRSGASRAVLEQVCGLRPRVVVYVACDPAALGRDVAVLAGRGYRLTSVRAFDLFPMTHHVECVAAFEPGPGDADIS